jgi:hypothetical protein
MTSGPKLDLKNPKYELYEQELQDLNREVSFHPDLQEFSESRRKKTSMCNWQTLHYSAG